MTLPDFLAQDKYGYIHLTDHRIGLVDIVYYYGQGDSPEMLRSRFPTVPLPLFCKLIGFYLENQKTVDEHCSKHAEEMARLRSEAPAGPSVEELKQRRETRRLAQGA